MGCLFCRIVVGEIPNYTVYQDDFVLAFLDIRPCSKGHTVVLPKKHFASVLEMSDEEWCGLMRGVKKAAERLQEVLRPDGMNIGINEKPAAGQAVPHVHWHILPRWENDGGGSMHSIIRRSEGGDVATVAALFKDHD